MVQRILQHWLLKIMHPFFEPYGGGHLQVELKKKVLHCAQNELQIDAVTRVWLAKLIQYIQYFLRSICISNFYSNLKDKLFIWSDIGKYRETEKVCKNVLKC